MNNIYKHYRKEEMRTKLRTIGINFLDVMVTGVTGAGKSTTLNALFEKDVAKVGEGFEPQTMRVDNYNLNDSFHLWDTPGLGDGIQKDKEHSKNIVDLLYQSYNGQNQSKHGYIDMVLVILDGSGRDMGTNYKLLNDVIVPHIQKSRIVVAINQADMAMKGRYWDYDANKPMKKLKDFLEEKADSVQKRVKEAAGVEIIRPIYFSGKYDYNIDILIDLLVDNIPVNKREFF